METRLTKPRFIKCSRWGYTATEIIALTHNAPRPADLSVVVTTGTLFHHLDKDAARTGCGDYTFHRNHDKERVAGERAFDVWRAI